MKDMSTVRMITANFSSLQGLKMVPLGLLLLLVSLWANALTAPARDFLFPGACMAAAFFLYWLIARFYSHTYGTVSPTRQQRNHEYLRGLVGGVIGLAAFLIDVYLRPAFSATGLMLAGVIAAEYVRLTRGMRWMPWWFVPNLLAFLLLVGLSLLPLAGVIWWKAVGIKALLVGVAAFSGALFMLIGVLAHILLARWLLPSREGPHGQRI